MDTVIAALPLAIPDAGSRANDLALLGQIACSVEAVARHIDPATCASPPYVVRHATDAGQVRRIVLYHRPDAVLFHPCTFVGFLGKKRRDVSTALMSAMVTADERLMEELVGHADLLAYASLELADRNWGNLVIFRRPEAVTVVLDKETHQHASRSLAPHYYQWIRLYHGLLPAGLRQQAADLVVTKSQQFSFATGASASSE